MWIDYEFAALKALYKAGADIPMPLARSGNAILMEYLGDRQEPAPIGANLRDQSRPQGSCEHGSLTILRHGCWYLEPATDLRVQMGPAAMTATQKAL
jgi:serine/threonine-protein kinase RIO1